MFAAAPRTVATAATLVAAPALAGEHLYALQLLQQAQISFVVAPGKHRSADGPYAGLARVTVPQAGSYRISLDAPLWIDVRFWQAYDKSLSTLIDEFADDVAARRR